jgi:glycosyltransferase involved in cell wall biosynthesis
MMPPPLVSVCIPTYRGEAHIVETIQSVLNQTLSDFELVVIDDSSPDGTAAAVQTFTDPRIRFLCNPSNLGPEGNWNRCLAEARGQYFKLLPHDDLLHPTCLQEQVAVLEADCAQAIALVFCGRTMIDNASKKLMVRKYPGHHGGRVASSTVFRQCLRQGTNLLGEPAGILMRTALAQQIGSFSAEFPYVTDLEYWFRLLLHGDAWGIDETLASFRISRGQWSVVIGGGQCRDFTRFAAHAAGRPEYGVGPYDVLVAHVMARLNNMLRLIYYRFALD